MPTPLLEKYAKKSNKTIEEAEECWESAKKQADHVFKRKNKEYWAYVNSKTKECLGLKNDRGN